MLIVASMQGQFRLPEDANEDNAKKVFQEAAKRVIKDSMRNARTKAVVTYHNKERQEHMATKDTKGIHLTAEQYLKGEVDWLWKFEDARNWLCEYWASEELIAISNRNRANRLNKTGMHFYGADGHIGMAQRMVYIITLIISLVVS